MCNLDSGDSAALFEALKGNSTLCDLDLCLIYTLFLNLHTFPDFPQKKYAAENGITFPGQKEFLNLLNLILSNSALTNLKTGLPFFLFVAPIFKVFIRTQTETNVLKT